MSLVYGVSSTTGCITGHKVHVSREVHAENDMDYNDEMRLRFLAVCVVAHL